MILFLKSLRRYLALFLQLATSMGHDRRRLPGFLLVLGLFPIALALQLLHWLTLLLDELLYRDYRDVAVREPLFVLGPPRSGTTHLHHVLSTDPGTTTFRTWECLFGLSVTSRRVLLALARLDRSLGRPVERMGSWLGRRLPKSMDDIHPVRLNDPEEDFLCLMPLAACFLLLVPFPRTDWLWRIARFDTDLDDDEKSELLEWYRRCIQKHLYVFGTEKRFLSKNASFSGMADGLLSEFPDARILYTARDPLAVVPSQLSSLRPVLAACGFRDYPEKLKNDIVQLLCFYYEHLAAVAAENSDRMAVIYIDDLRNDLAGTVVVALESVGLSVDDGFRKRLLILSGASREHRSGHHYTSGEFGLSDDTIAAQFERVYELYHFRRQSPPEDQAQ